MEKNNRVDELIGLWTTVVFGYKMTLDELSNSPQLRELSIRQYEVLDTLLSSQLCAGRTGVRRCPVCPKDNDSLLRCHLVVRYIKDEIEEISRQTQHAPVHIRKVILSRLSEVEETLHRYSGGMQAHESPAPHSEQHRTG